MDNSPGGVINALPPRPTPATDVLRLTRASSSLRYRTMYLKMGRLAGSACQHLCIRERKAGGQLLLIGGLFPARIASIMSNLECKSSNGRFFSHSSHKTMPKLYTSILTEYFVVLLAVSSSGAHHAVVPKLDVISRLELLLCSSPMALRRDSCM